MARDQVEESRLESQSAPAQVGLIPFPFGISRASVDWTVVVTVLALLAGAAWLVYGRAIDAPFIFDDRNSVVQNTSIVKLLPLLGESDRGGPLAPLKDTVTAGRPLVNLSLALNYYFGHLTPTGYHIVNMVAHVLSAAMLWLIVARTLHLPCFGGRFAKAAGPLAFVVALVWEMHPLQTEAVEYVSQRTELMVAFFYLATLLASLRYWTAQSSAARSGWLGLAATACAMGMACKEVMVTAPVIVLLYERTFIAGSFRRAVRDSWPLYVGLGLGWLALLALNINGPRSASAGFSLGVTAPDWWLTQSEVLSMYLKLAVWPWPLVIHYDMPYHHSLATAWPWVLLVAALVIGTLLLLLRNQPAGFLGACVLVILSPTLLVPIPSEIAAERRMYLPLAAIATLAVVGGFAIVNRLLQTSAKMDRALSTSSTGVKVTVISAVAMATLFGMVSIRRLGAYSDLLTLWQDAAIHQPDNALVLVSLGASLTGAGRYDDAINTLRHALDITADSAALGIHKQLGAALFQSGRQQEAVEHLSAAVRLDPDAPGVERLLGVALNNTNRAPEAIPHLEQAIQQEPNDAEAHDNLGAAYLNADRQPEAIASFQRALELHPNYVSAQFNLAIAQAKANRPREAIAAAEAARELAIRQDASEIASRISAWLEGYRQAHPSP